jgi:hypothetical protein
MAWRWTHTAFFIMKFAFCEGIFSKGPTMVGVKGCRSSRNKYPCVKDVRPVRSHDHSLLPPGGVEGGRPSLRGRFHDFRLAVLCKRWFFLLSDTLHRNRTEGSPRPTAHLNVKSSCYKPFFVAASVALCVRHSRVELGRVNCYCAQGGAVKANTHRSRSCDIQQAPVWNIVC